MPFERIRWQVLNSFKTLPSSYAAKKMTELDYIYCYVNMLIDQESESEYNEKSVNENFNIEVYKDKGGV